MPVPKYIQEERQELVDKVVKDIKEGKPFFWDSGTFNAGRPRNLLQAMKNTDKYYNGINSMQLTIAAQMRGFKDSRWATYKQALEAGGHVKRGAKGTHIEYWQFTKDVMQVNPETGKKEPVYITNENGNKQKKTEPLEHPIVKHYTVFNGDQIEGIEPDHPITIKDEDKNMYMENMIKNSEAEIIYDQKNKNYYGINSDEIHLMPREEFKTMDAFYSTAAHEIAHSTGAAKRLDRATIRHAKGFGTEDYAKEELRAEMTSMFVQQKYNIRFDRSHYENHAAYLQSWAKVLKDNPDELFKAAADAEKAMAYIDTRMIQKNLTKEQSLNKTPTQIDEKTVAPSKTKTKPKIKQKLSYEPKQQSKSKERTLTR